MHRTVMRSKCKDSKNFTRNEADVRERAGFKGVMGDDSPAFGSGMVEGAL